MQIHELNPFQGTLGSEAFLVVDNGDDTGKISVERLTQPINDRIDDIITSPAPTEQEIIDARRGWNEVVYSSLGAAIRSQVKQILAQFYKFNTYDLLAVYGTPISRTRNGVTFTWDDAGQVCEVTGEAVGGDAYASIYTQTGAWPGIFEHGVVYTIGYETTDPNVKLRIAVWEGVETTPDYYYFDEDGHFGIPPEAAKIGIDLYVASGDTVSAVVKNVYMLRTYTAKEVTATIRDAMIGADLRMYNSLGDAIREQLNGKVDKVTGKVLSTNDFTDAEKTKLSGIETGAEVNAIEAIKLDGTELTPDENRAVDIPVDETLTVEGVPADAKTVGEGLESKLAIDGYSELATVGNAEQLVATQHITDTEPYIYRKTGGPNDVGDRVYDTLVGGSVVWNQLIKNGNFESVNTWSTAGYGNYTVSNNIGDFTITATGSSARIEQPSYPVKGHKYFAVAAMKADFATSFVITFQGSGAPIAQKSNVSANTWVNLAGIKDAVDSDLTAHVVRFYFGNASASVGDHVYIKNCMLIDLTDALGSIIADYVYTLETATAGAGVAWFKKYFPKEYHEFCEPHFEHVQTSAKETVGFNQWDEEWERGTLGTNGAPISSTTNIRSKNFIPAFSGMTYYIKSPYTAGIEIYQYDGEQNYITRGFVVNSTVTLDSRTKYLKFRTPDGVTTYNNDICINFHGDRDGEYEPYRKRIYPIEPKVLRGVPKLDASNRLYFDGDIYRHDGGGEQRYSEITFNGSEDWRKGGEANVYYVTLNSTTFPYKWASSVNSASVGYSFYGTATGGYNNLLTDRQYVMYYAANTSSAREIAFRNESITSLDNWKASLQSNPITVLYELNTPEPFAAEPFQSPMVVDPLGTEEFVDYAVEQGDRDVAIPVGHTSEYPADLRGKLQHLPSLSTSGDGRYVVVQTGNQMTLSPDTSLGLIAALEARVAALEGGNG